MKVKISDAWNKHHGKNSVKNNNRTDLDLGDMLKISEQSQIEAELEGMEKLEKMIELKKKEVAKNETKKEQIKENFKNKNSSTRINI